MFKNSNNCYSFDPKIANDDLINYRNLYFKNNKFVFSAHELELFPNTIALKSITVS